MIKPTLETHGGVAVARWCIAHAIADTLSGPNERVRVGTIASQMDPPGVILRRSDSTNLIEQGAGSFCVYEVEFEALLLAGTAPGSDGVQQLLDRWVGCITGPDALVSAKDGDVWPSQLAPPIVESVGADLVYDIFGSQLLGCAVQILCQVHLEGIQEGAG